MSVAMRDGQATRRRAAWALAALFACGCGVGPKQEDPGLTGADAAVADVALSANDSGTQTAFDASLNDVGSSSDVGTGTNVPPRACDDGGADAAIDDALLDASPDAVTPPCAPSDGAVDGDDGGDAADAPTSETDHD
jgi:hypothetical protein